MLEIKELRSLLLLVPNRRMQTKVSKQLEETLWLKNLVEIRVTDIECLPSHALLFIGTKAQCEDFRRAHAGIQISTVSSSDIADLPAAIVSASQSKLESLSRLHTSVLAANFELRKEIQNTKTSYTFLRDYVTESELPEERRVYSCQDATFYYKPKTNRAKLKQTVPLSTRGLSSLNLFFEIHDAPEHYAGWITVSLIALEEGKVFAKWRIPYSELTDGELKLELMTPSPDLHRSVEISVEWDGEARQHPKIGLVKAASDEFAAHDIDSNDNGPFEIAIIAFQSLPGKGPVSPSYWAAESFEDVNVDSSLYVSRSGLSGARIIQGKSGDGYFARSKTGVLIHPLENLESIAILPAMVPARSKRVIAEAHLKHKKSPDVEFALVIADRGLEITEGAFVLSDLLHSQVQWHSATALTPKTIVVDYAESNECRDLYIATRVPAGSSNSYAWAHVENIRFL